MKRHNSFITYLGCIIFGMAIVLSACKKGFLEEQQNSRIVIPSTLDHFQKLLDADIYLKQTPALGEIGSDDYYSSTNYWKSLPIVSERNQYIWAKDIFNGTETNLDWKYPYQQVFYANIVLDGLSRVPLTQSNSQEWNNIKGSALFLRAYAFFNVAQVFAPVYDENSDSNPFGIPLRLSPNVDEETARSTVAETYNRILSDLQEAKRLLSHFLPVQNRNRPSRLAADAMLARVYLTMRNYGSAKLYADSLLLSYDKLIDYNTLSTISTIPFSRLNEEVIYQSNIYSESGIITGINTSNGLFVDSNLYNSYHANDLRRELYFTSDPRAKGSYAERQRFSGLATDEVLLTRAECKARSGDIVGSIEDLNKLLVTRWKKMGNQSTYVNYTAGTEEEALKIILEERRKELVFRGLRWSDLRRLNKEGAGITLTRMIDGVTYELPPNDPRYVLPIPNDIIAFTGIKQNPR